MSYIFDALTLVNIETAPCKVNVNLRYCMCISIIYKPVQSVYIVVHKIINVIYLLLICVWAKPNLISKTI